MLSLLAGAALLVFLRQYREDVTSTDRARVLVAASLVPKGTPGDVILEQKMYRVARIREDDLRDGAVTDASELNGRVATGDIAPGQQITSGKFEDADGKIGTHLANFNRGMTVPLDRAHGMVGKIDVGDRVDVITTTDSNTGGVTIANIAARDSLVLAVPDGEGSGSATTPEQVTIRVSDSEAAAIAAASDSGNVWLVLRPAVGAREHQQDAVATGNMNGQPVNADVNITARVRSR